MAVTLPFGVSRGQNVPGAGTRVGESGNARPPEAQKHRRDSHPACYSNSQLISGSSLGGGGKANMTDSELIGVEAGAEYLGVL